MTQYFSMLGFVSQLHVVDRDLEELFGEQGHNSGIIAKACDIVARKRATAQRTIWRRFTMTEKHPDAELLAMVGRHDHLWALCTPQACESGEANAFMDECLQLEVRIIATPVFTSQGLAGKQRVVERAELDDGEAVVAAILRADEERVGGGASA